MVRRGRALEHCGIHLGMVGGREIVGSGSVALTCVPRVRHNLSKTCVRVSKCAGDLLTCAMLVGACASADHAHEQAADAAVSPQPAHTENGERDAGTEAEAGSPAGRGHAAGGGGNSGSGGARDDADGGGHSGSGGSASVYATDFDAAESPISEGGRWKQHGGATGLDWSDVRTSRGLAYGSQTGFDGYNDSIALLSGFGANYRLRAVVHFNGTRSASTGTHEVELILRGSYTPHVQHLYECNLGYAGERGWYAQIMRLNGALGEFTEVGSAVSQVPEVHDGTVFEAEIIGNVMQSFVDGVKVQTATDSVLQTGSPGIGFFWRGTERVDDLTFTSLTVNAL